MIVESLLREVLFAIPTAILEMTYGHQYRSIITYDLINGKFADDMNMGYGKTVDYSLNNKDVVKRDIHTNEVYFKVNMDSKIIVPLELYLQGSMVYTMAGAITESALSPYPTMNNNNSTAIMMELAVGPRPDQGIITSFKRHGSNIFSIFLPAQLLDFSILRMRVYKSLDEFGWGNVPEFGGIVVNLVKADIYTKQLLDSEYGFSRRGISNPAIQNVIQSYSNSLEDYNTARKTIMPQIAIADDYATYEDLVRQQIPNLL